MKLVQQELQDTDNILLVSPQNTPFDIDFRKTLLSFPSEVITQKSLPENLSRFKYIFLIDPVSSPSLQKELTSFSGKICIIITTKNSTKYLEKYTKSSSVKLVICSKSKPTREIIEKIMWFLVTDSSVQVLQLDSTLPIHREKKLSLPKINISKKKGGFFLFAFLIFLEFFFTIPLFISSVLLYNASLALKKQDIAKTRQYLSTSVPFLQLTKDSYQFSRPVLSFFFLALVPDSFVETTHLSYSLLEKIASIHDTGYQTMALILKTDKTTAEKKETAKKT
jgi:hypothetical protein